MGVLRQAEGGSPGSELYREHGISSATCYKWRAKYGGMDASMMSQMKALEDENQRLKRMFADLTRRVSRSALRSPRTSAAGSPSCATRRTIPTRGSPVGHAPLCGGSSGNERYAVRCTHGTDGALGPALRAREGVDRVHPRHLLPARSCPHTEPCAGLAGTPRRRGMRRRTTSIQPFPGGKTRRVGKASRSLTRALKFLEKHSFKVPSCASMSLSRHRVQFEPIRTG